MDSSLTENGLVKEVMATTKANCVTEVENSNFCTDIMKDAMDVCEASQLLNSEIFQSRENPSSQPSPPISNINSTDVYESGLENCAPLHIAKNCAYIEHSKFGSDSSNKNKSSPRGESQDQPLIVDDSGLEGRNISQQISTKVNEVVEVNSNNKKLEEENVAEGLEEVISSKFISTEREYSADKCHASFLNGITVGVSSSVLSQNKIKDIKVVKKNELEEKFVSDIVCDMGNVNSESRNSLSKKAPDVQSQIFEDITEDEDDEALEVIELVDLVTPNEFDSATGYSDGQKCDKQLLAAATDLNKPEREGGKQCFISSTYHGNLSSVGGNTVDSSLKTDMQNAKMPANDSDIKTDLDKPSHDLGQTQSYSSVFASESEEKQDKIYTSLPKTELFKAMTSKPSETDHVRKQKFTARKTGKPIKQKDCLNLKTIDLHPIKNITMKVSDIEGALDLGPLQDSEGIRRKSLENVFNKDTILAGASVSTLDLENCASKDLTCQKKKKRKNTYDLPGCMKKPKKVRINELQSKVSSAQFQDVNTHTNTASNKDMVNISTERVILSGNSNVSVTKKLKSFSMTSSLTSLSSEHTSPSHLSSLPSKKPIEGKNNNKMKTVLDMLLERSKQKAELDDKTTTSNISQIISVTTSATSTTTTVLVLPPPNKPLVEGIKRKGTPKKLKGKKDSISSNIALLPTAVTSAPHSLLNKQKTSTIVSQPPLVMFVAQHSSASGLRSLLPRNSTALCTDSSIGQITQPSFVSKHSPFSFISTIPMGTNQPPGLTAVPNSSLSPGSQPTTFLTTVPASVATLLPISNSGSNLVNITSPKQFMNNASPTKSIETTSKTVSGTTLLTLPSTKTSSTFSTSGSSESLRALLVKPHTMVSVPTSSQLQSSPTFFQMATTSGNNLVQVPVQYKTLTPSSVAAMIKPSSSIPLGKSSNALLKSHPTTAHSGISCLTPPKTPDTDSSSEVAASASLSQPSADQVNEAEVLPLCCCKINGTSFSKLSAGVTYCQALDTVDNKVLGCCNKVTNTQLVRPGVKIPFMAVCEAHRKRLKLHQCCPGCGHFCTQGKFQQCRKEGTSSVHNVHKQCVIYHGDKYHCLHCGEETIECEVELHLSEEKLDKLKLVQSRLAMAETEKKSRRIRSKNFVKSKSTSEAKAVTPTLPGKKVNKLETLPLGPDNQILTRLHRCATEDRPKKYRTIPKDLYTLAYEGDLERVFFLLVDGVNPNSRFEDSEDQTAMHAAAISGSIGTVFVLQQFGAEIHAQDKTLRTPLMCAAENGHLKVVKFLIKAGAKVEDRGEDGMTSLHYAAKAGYIDIIKHIFKLGKLMVNIQDDGGWTPIIWATESQLPNIVKYLLEQGGDPNKKDNEENTGLHWAAFSGSLEIAEMFLDMGCEIDAVNEHGDRPLHIAARQDHYDIVVLLLARGADVDTRNNKDESPVESCVNKSGQVWTALKVNQQLRSFATRKLIHPEKHLERDITMGRERNPIACVNSEDSEPCPADYMYVSKNVVTSPLSINNVITSLQSCQCRDNCSSIHCECVRSNAKCGMYDMMGRLLEEVNLFEPPPLFECNRACRCWMNCKNRVVQNGIVCQLQMFKTSNKGWGVRTLIDIPRGTFVCEYVGELISESEADRRDDDSYLFDLGNKEGEAYCIDGRKYGNISRFINHLCEPNLAPVKVFVEHQDLCFPRMCLFSCRDVKAYEELGFDYGERFWMVKSQHFTCACKSVNCRYNTETIGKTLADYKLQNPHVNMDIL